MSDKTIQKTKTSVTSRLYTPQWNDFLDEMFPGINHEKITRALTAKFTEEDHAILKKHSDQRWERRRLLKEIRRKHNHDFDRSASKGPMSSFLKDSACKPSKCNP